MYCVGCVWWQGGRVWVTWGIAWGVSRQGRFFTWRVGPCGKVAMRRKGQLFLEAVGCVHTENSPIGRRLDWLVPPEPSSCLVICLSSNLNWTNCHPHTGGDSKELGLAGARRLAQEGDTVSRRNEGATATCSVKKLHECVSHLTLTQLAAGDLLVQKAWTVVVYYLISDNSRQTEHINADVIPVSRVRWSRQCLLAACVLLPLSRGRNSVCVCVCVWTCECWSVL